MDINYHLLIDIVLVLGVLFFDSIARKLKTKNPDLLRVAFVPTMQMP